jgi:hypothetical protein
MGTGGSTVVVARPPRGPGSREPSRRRLGHPASIPRARHKERLAGGTRERGSPSANAITSPFTGAFLTGLGVTGFTPLRCV